MCKRIFMAVAVAFVVFVGTAQAKQPKNIGLSVLSTYENGVFDEGAAEIVAYDPATQGLFVINADAKTVDILDISDPTNPTLYDTIVVSSIKDSGGINSVAVRDGLVAVAVEHKDKQSNGWAAFYNTDGSYINHVGAGPLPDMVTITHNGNYALVANEGEPSGDYANDPEGSITVIDLRNGAANATTMTAVFTGFNEAPPAGVRYSIPTPTTTFAQDMEPEYIATSQNSRTAWVTLQENNAIAIVDIPSATVTNVVGLGNKDHSLSLNGLDASNEDDAINITSWPVLGTYMPDAIAAYRTRGRTYLVTANEGDAREYAYDASEEDCLDAGHVYDDGVCFSWVDETRVKDVTLDPSVFMDDTLQEKPKLGRLKMLTTEGNTDGDDEYEEIHAFGARSISIWDVGVSLVADTGDTIERETAIALPDDFNYDDLPDHLLDAPVNAARSHTGGGPPCAAQEG